MTVEEEVIELRAEVASLKEQLAQALAMIAQLRTELDTYRSEPPSFVKPNTPKSKDQAQNQQCAKNISHFIPPKVSAKHGVAYTH